MLSQAKGATLVALLITAAPAGAALCGCGSGNSGANGSGSYSSGGGSGPTYAFITPGLNSVRTYSETIVDNSDNVINLSYTETVTAVMADDSFTVLQEDPTQQSITVNGTTYSVTTDTVSVNNSGQEVGDSTDNGTCTYLPHGAGPDFPVQVGMTWTLTYTVACTATAPFYYSQSGTVADIESVTVPAGTYSAIKLQSTLTWTDTQGTTRTQTITNWRDVATTVSVKQTIDIAYSGTLPTHGYPVSRQILLESES